ncbi:MAG: DUF4279 domain-containing protein [Tepidisphaeraceae bacterium]
MPAEEVSLSEHAKWSRATFRISSNELSPEAMGDALGLRPTASHRKGELVSKRSAGVRKEHCIRIESALPTSDPLERHLAALCDLLEPVAPKLAGIAHDCEYDIFCGFSSGNGQGGFTLSPELLNRLAALKVELVVDLYPPTAVRPEA